jgi:hypothetical protein
MYWQYKMWAPSPLASSSVKTYNADGIREGETITHTMYCLQYRRQERGVNIMTIRQERLIFLVDIINTKMHETKQLKDDEIVRTDKIAQGYCLEVTGNYGRGVVLSQLTRRLTSGQYEETLTAMVNVLTFRS